MQIIHFPFFHFDLDNSVRFYILYLSIHFIKICLISSEISKELSVDLTLKLLECSFVKAVTSKISCVTNLHSSLWWKNFLRFKRFSISIAISIFSVFNGLTNKLSYNFISLSRYHLISFSNTSLLVEKTPLQERRTKKSFIPKPVNCCKVLLRLRYTKAEMNTTFPKKGIQKFFPPKFHHFFSWYICFSSINISVHRRLFLILKIFSVGLHYKQLKNSGELHDFEFHIFPVVSTPSLLL